MEEAALLQVETVGGRGDAVVADLGLRAHWGCAQVRAVSCRSLAQTLPAPGPGEQISTTTFPGSHGKGGSVGSYKPEGQ